MRSGLWTVKPGMCLSDARQERGRKAFRLPVNWGDLPVAPGTLSKSACLSPAKVGEVRDLCCLSLRRELGSVGTVVDWRSGISSAVRVFAADHALTLDPVEFADAWRAQYQPSMERVRSGQRPTYPSTRSTSETSTPPCDRTTSIPVPSRQPS